MRAALELLPIEELERLPKEELEAEVFLAFCKGMTQADLARHCKVTPPTIMRWRQNEMRRRQGRFADREMEFQELIGQIDAIIGYAWAEIRHIPDNSLAKPQMLRTILDAVREKGRFLGYDTKVGAEPPRAGLKVSVRIGGRSAPDVDNSRGDDDGISVEAMAVTEAPF